MKGPLMHINLRPDQKEWLERKAAERDQSQTAIIRTAVDKLRRQWEAEEPCQTT